MSASEQNKVGTKNWNGAVLRTAALPDSRRFIDKDFDKRRHVETDAGAASVNLGREFGRDIA